MSDMVVPCRAVVLQGVEDGSTGQLCNPYAAVRRAVDAGGSAISVDEPAA